MWLRLALIPALACASVAPLTGCIDGSGKESSLQYSVSSSSLELGDARYDQDDPPRQVLSVLNRDTRALYVSSLGVSGAGAAMLEVSFDNFTEIEPEESADVTVSVIEDVLLWDHGSYEVGLSFEVGADAEDTGEWESEVFTVAVTFTLDCDLDDDGAEGETTGGADCDDEIAEINPLATELCNEVDDDCDGGTDEDDAADALTWYQDADDDDYGDAAASTLACERPDGFVANDTDCDDGNGEVYPGADELCNAIDDDCDGDIDEDDARDASEWFQDADGDGFGDEIHAVEACDQPDNHVSNAEDCDDTDAAVNPGAEETCNAIDDDCDDRVDEYLTECE